MTVISSSAMNFSNVMKDILDDYGDEIYEVMDEVIPEVAKEAAKKLRQESPKKEGKGGGKYAKGWTYETQSGRLVTTSTVYGKHGTYQLAHLLEHGHAKRNGGRVDPVPAGGHIAPVEEWAIDEAQTRIKEKIGG